MSSRIAVRASSAPVTLVYLLAALTLSAFGAPPGSPAAAEPTSPPAGDAAHHFAELASSLTGMDLDVDRLMRIGLQVHNLEKAFNTLHGGFTRRDDYPPKRYWTEPVKSGPYAGERIDHEAWERMLDDYYSLHGWDKETGLQTRQALEALDLKSIADRLEAAGCLP